MDNEGKFSKSSLSYNSTSGDMKTLLLLTAMLFFDGLPSNAQNKKVELYDLIKGLLPDSAQATTEVSWAKLKSNRVVQWPATTPKLNGATKKYRLSTLADIAIKGETFPVEWTIDLEGNTKGYTHISISPELSDMGFETTLESLFGDNQYRMTVVKECDNAQEAMYYEVAIPGKKTFWMACYNDGGSAGSAIYIDCYFAEGDMEVLCL